jgi:S1-C subfamily serine protease
VSRKSSLWIDRDNSRDPESGPFSAARWRRQAEQSQLRREQPSEPPPAEPPPPRSRWRRLLPGLALLAALAALAVSVVAIVDPGQSDQAGLLPAAGGGRPAATQIGRVYQSASPGVVSVQVGSASGTGFVVRSDGTIVTNEHVVGDAETAQVRFGEHGRTVQAEVLGADSSSDLAVLRVDPGSVGKLRPLPLANSDDVSVGDSVVAIGQPFGLDRTATAGIVSAVGREIQAPDGFQIDHVIQTDAPINPGNSGGPLLDAKGQVIGINEQIASSSGSNSGVGFAIPVTSVRYSLDQLKADGKVEYAYLGVTSESLYPQLAEHLGIDSHSGALISDVVNGSPADKAGLKGSTGETTFQLQHIKTGGDVVIAVDGKPVLQNNDLSKLIAVHKPGDTVTLDIIRDGHPASVDVTLGSRPADVNQ